MPEEPGGRSPSAALKGAGLTPRKRLGQNFLRDRSVLPRIMQAAELDLSDEVLEIGAGTGVLTEALARSARSVIAIELDDALYSLLSERFAEVPSVRLLHGNALDLEPCRHFEGEYKLVANIPYYITGPLVRHFLEARCSPAVMVLMVQREVAERMAATPPNMSLLGVSVQFYADVKFVARVPAGAFYPPPKVESAIVRLVPRHASAGVNTEAFFTVARAGFGQRRKQVVNSLSAGLGITREEARRLLLGAGIEPSARAETIPLDAWIRLARVWNGGRT